MFVDVIEVNMHNESYKNGKGRDKISQLLF